MGSLYLYAVMRAITFRRMRAPAPQVKIGDKVSHPGLHAAPWRRPHPRDISEAAASDISEAAVSPYLRGICPRVHHAERVVLSVAKPNIHQ